jgi:preprotein translocase subunit YajC
MNFFWILTVVFVVMVFMHGVRGQQKQQQNPMGMMMQFPKMIMSQMSSMGANQGGK